MWHPFYETASSERPFVIPLFAESAVCDVGLLASGRISAVEFEGAKSKIQILLFQSMAPIATSLLLLLLAAGVLFVHCSPQEQLQGKLETKDGSMCVWFELRKSGRGNVFVTACHCKDEDGHRHSYSCEYDGPMEDCEVYQSDPKDFYNIVATSLLSKLSMQHSSDFQL